MINSYELNCNPPHLMHIDLNSCFATIEQQANPHLRNRPTVVVPFISRNAVVIAPSIEAKQLGIKTCYPLRDARLICKDLAIRVADPRKYRDVHIKFRNIFKDYSPNVYALSIDEAIIDFSGTKALYGSRTLQDIAREIKFRMREEIGEWISCSIGISTNMLLAKLAASLKKPDGLVTINSRNLLDVYSNITLTDLPGIAEHNQARLNTMGIFTVMDFLEAPEEVLKRFVFKSIVGSYWYSKLRGFEADPFEHAKSQFGKQYSLQHPTNDPKAISARLMKLCEGAGRKMRKFGYAAYGAHIMCSYDDHTWWHRSMKFRTEAYSLMDLYQRAQLVLNYQPERKVITKLGISFQDVIPNFRSQLSLFDEVPDRSRKIADVMDQINDRYGEYTIHPLRMTGLDNEAPDRIAFGGTGFIEDLYN